MSNDTTRPFEHLMNPKPSDFPTSWPDLSKTRLTPKEKMKLLNILFEKDLLPAGNYIPLSQIK